MLSKQPLTDEQIREFRAQRQRDREQRGVLGAIQAQQAMGRGHSGDLDTILSGVLQGAGFGWGDELLGGARDFKHDREHNAVLYDASSLAAMTLLGNLVTRLPLKGRTNLFNEARDLLGGEGVAQRSLANPKAAKGLDGMLPFADRRFEASLPYVPAERDIATLAARGNGYDASRLTQERGDALAQAEELLALRRRAVDNYSGLDAALHGAAIGSGGVDPGDTPTEERLTGGVLGALGATALAKGSSELKDLSGYLAPGRGARWSAQEVVDLPGKTREAANVEDFLSRARMFEEQAFRDRTHDTFFGRSAGYSPELRKNPFVAPIDDSNALIRGTIAKAHGSGTGRDLSTALDDKYSVGQALERFGGLHTTTPAPPQDLPPLLPAHVRAAMPAALRDDAMMRPDALRSVMGDARFFPQGGEGGVDPALRSPRMRKPNEAQYPGFNQGQRVELAHLVADDAMAQATRLARLPPAQQPGEAKRLLQYLDDPHMRRMMQTLQLREGNQSPLVQRMGALRDGLERLASYGTDAPTLMKGFDRGGSRGVDPHVADAAHAIARYPMSKRMAEAILDEKALQTPREAYWVNPEGRGDAPMVQVRRESVRPPWPYRAPAGVGTQVAADWLAYGLDHLQHGARAHFAAQ